MRTKLTIAVILSWFLLLSGACTPSLPVTTTPAETLVPAGYTYIDYPSSNTSSEQLMFELTKVVWGPYSIYILGSTELAEGTRLRAYLYKDDKAIDWWPKDRAVRPEKGTWEFNVKSNDTGVPEELPEFERGYSLWIFDIDNAEVTAQLSLDSPGPPFETKIPGSAATIILELEGSRWQLSSLNGTKLLSSANITLEFKQGKAGGMTDCNRYGGGYVIKAPNLINIYQIVTTMLLCPNGSERQSDVYLGYLNNAICYRIIDKHLEMYDVKTNNRTLVFERLQ